MRTSFCVFRELLDMIIVQLNECFSVENGEVLLIDTYIYVVFWLHGEIFGKSVAL